MATAATSLHVEAAAEQVWEFLQTSRSIVEWWPGCVERHDRQPLSEGGFAFRWSDNATGVTLCGEVEEVLVEAGEDIRVHVAGDICGTIRWRMRPDARGVQVMLEADYAIPIISLLLRLSPRRLLRFQHDEANAIAARLQGRFNGKEAEVPPRWAVAAAVGSSRAVAGR